ncbi:MAG: cation:proton antiporter, partial [Ilumatobacter sp.]
MHLQVQMLAATGSEAAIAFVEIGVIAVGLSFLALIAGRFGITAVPLYLIAGLAFGDGGIVDVTASSDFVSLTAEIGVLLLLLTLGLEYSADELRTGIRTGVLPGLLDMALNFTPGVALGLLLGWSTPASVLLGGITWVSSSGIISKVLNDLGRLGNRETPTVLNLLVIEDLAMAVYLPVAAALVIGGTAADTALTVGIALVTVVVILWGVNFVAMKWGLR